MAPLIISPDEAKKKIKSYHPSKAEFFHQESSKMADREFEAALKKIVHKDVILMNGGSASGKTEFLSEYLDEFKGIIFDGTLSTIEGAKIKIRKIVKEKKKAIVCAIIPDDLKRAFSAFLYRERKFNDRHFYRTHAGSRKVLLWIAKNSPETKIKIYESHYSEKEDMNFRLINFSGRKDLIEFLNKIQYTEQVILKKVAYEENTPKKKKPE